MSSSPYPDGPHHRDQQPVVRDKRRIDPATGRMREQAAAASEPPPYESLFGGGQPSRQPGDPQQPRQQQPVQPTTPPQPDAVAAENNAARASYVSAATKAYAQTQASAGQQPPAAAPPPPTPAAQPQEQTPPAAEAGAGVPDVATQLAERTADLQRVNAEYANYRRRVEREREASKTQAIASVATNLLPLLDDIDRAREHGDLTGGFKSVGEALELALSKLGVTKFGQAGEAFDPNIHEAMMHTHSDQVSETTAVQVLQAGYMLGDKLLRPARVAVADPQ